MKQNQDGTVRTAVTGDLFIHGSVAQLDITVRRKSDVSVFASSGRLIVKKILTRGRHELILGKLPVDHYTVKLKVGAAFELTRTFGVVPRRRFKGDVEANHYGINAKVGLRFGGVGMALDGVLKGKPGEMNWKDNRKMADGTNNWFPSAGSFNLEGVARQVEKAGLETLGSVDLKSGNWEIGNIGTTRLVPIYEHLDEVGACIYEYVKRCKIKYLIIWNEPEFYWNLGEASKPEDGNWHGRFIKQMPMSEYVNLLKTCYASAKQADPSCLVILGASLRQGQFTDNVYKWGGKPYFDIVGFHYLGGHSYYCFGWQVKYLREIMKRHGDDKPIFDTEFGCGGAQPWDAVSGGSLFAASFETKYIALSVMHNTVPCCHFMQLTGDSGAPTHAVALSVITWLLDGATFIRDLELGRNDAGLLFKRKNGSLCGVFWAETRLKTVIKTDAASLKVRSILGPSRSMKTENGLLKLDLNDVPLILEGFKTIEVVEKPYDCSDYRRVTDIDPISMSKASRALPRAFPRVAKGAIAVDAELSDWSSIPAICAPNNAHKVKALKRPDYYKFDRYQCLMGEARVAYDEDHLYVAAIVKKDKKAQINLDSANVMFSLRGFDWGVQWSDFSKGHSMVALMAREGSLNVIQIDGYDMSVPERELTEAKIAVRSLPADLVFEAAIPWKVFHPIRPIPGKIIELSILFGGDDGNDYFWWYRLIGTHWYVRPPATKVELKF